MNQTICNFPYYNINNDCMLYKTIVGDSYINTQISFLFFSILGIILSVITCIYTFKIDKKGLTIKHMFVFLLFLSFILIMIQFIDPFGFGGWMTHSVEVFISDLSAWLSLIVVFSILLIFTKVFFNFKNNNFIKYQISGIILSVIITIVTSILQVYVDRSTWRGIKLIFFAITNLFLMYWLNFFIKKSILMGLGNNEIFIHKLYDTATMFNIFFSIILTFQLVIGINSFYQPDIIKPEITFNNLILSSFHVVCNYFGLFYFSGLRYKSSGLQYQENLDV